jgi:uncharacterized protein (TIGR03067 family)
MKSKSSTGIILASFVIAFSSSAAGDDTPLNGDLAKLQGTWTAMVGPKKNFRAVATIEGKVVTVKRTNPNGEETQVTCEIQIDEQAKPLKTIDWVKFIQPDGAVGQDTLGIYEIVDEDTVRICNGGPGGQRPTEFKEGENGRPQLITMKRQAKSK